MDEDVRPALAKKVPLSALPTSRSLPSPPYSESFPVPSERKSRSCSPPRVSFPASPQRWSSPVRTGVGARHHPVPLMRLMIEVQCETRVAETILGRSRVCNGANSGRLASILVNSCQHDRNCLFLKTCLFFFRSHLPSSWVFVGFPSPCCCSVVGALAVCPCHPTHAGRGCACVHRTAPWKQPAARVARQSRAAWGMMRWSSPARLWTWSPAVCRRRAIRAAAIPAKPENVHRIATTRRSGGRKDREIPMTRPCPGR